MDTIIQEKMIRKGSVVWNKWRSKNHQLLYFKNSIWHDAEDAVAKIRLTLKKGRSVTAPKRRNRLNFSGSDMSNTRLIKVTAEGLNMQGCIFDSAHFEEGDFSRANFTNSRFINTTFNKTILTNANFSGCTFINCNLNRVNLTSSNFCVKEIRDTVVYGISAWDLKTRKNMKQSNLIIEKTYRLYSDFKDAGEIPLMVDNIELAQFIYYLSNHKNMRNAIDILNSQGVLLLGKFKEGGLNRLYLIKKWLQKNKYMPMIFDFDRPRNLDLIETIITMSGLSKFIIADLSGNSVPQELLAITKNFKKPIVTFSNQASHPRLRALDKKKSSIVHLRIQHDKEIIPGIAEIIPQLESANASIIMKLATTYKNLPRFRSASRRIH